MSLPHGLPLDPALPEPLARREFLRLLAGAGLATLSLGAPKLLGADDKPVVHPPAKADACILIWLAGGMAAPETFDPKRYAPYEKGLEYKRVLSTFPAINTSVDGVRICQGLESIAQVMDRATLIRSAVQPDLGSILHSRHQFHWHTGYVPPQTVAAPHIGAWMARVLGPRNPVMPAFINIGQRLEGVGESEELKAFTTGGFFGGEYGPMNLPFPEDAAAAVRPPKGMDAGRFVNRDKEFRRLVDATPHRDLLSDYQQESMLRSMDNAYRLLSAKERAAFDLTLEPKEVQQAYDTSRFGRGCLLARRLVDHDDPPRLDARLAVPLAVDLLGLSRFSRQQAQALVDLEHGVGQAHLQRRAAHVRAAHIAITHLNRHGWRARSRAGKMHQPHRFFRASAARPRNASNRDGDVGLRMRQRALRHCAGCLRAHGAVGFN